MPEYMAMGKLAVATRVSGCPYLLRDGAGVLVAPNDWVALRDGIERALALSPAEAAATIEQARRNVSQFTWRQGITEVDRVYRRLARRNSGSGIVQDTDSHRHTT
jgi:glycosyltransferase involved in cell wall biosynthesis